MELNKTESILESENIRDRLYLSVYFITGILALFGNTIVVKVVWTIPKMRTFVHILLANMAVSDIICAISFFTGLIFCSDIIITYWGHTYCVANKAIQLLSFQISSLTMTIVAIDRWISVFFPFYHRKFTKHSSMLIKIIISGIWIFSCAIIIGTSPSLGIQRYFVNNGPIIQCEFAKAFDFGSNSTRTGRIKLIIANLAHFWIPLLIITIVYSSISVKVWKRQLGHDLAKSQVDLMILQKWKTIRMLIFSVVIFIICWIPFFTFNIIAFTADASKTRPCNQSTAYLVAIWFAFSSCCYNPFVYWIYNDMYRNGIMNFFNMMVCNSVETYWKWKRNRPSQEPIHPLA